MKQLKFVLFIMSLVVFIACSSTEGALILDKEGAVDRSPTATAAIESPPEMDQSVVVSLAQPISQQAALSLLREIEVRPLELIIGSSDEIQAGYVLQPTDTLDSALSNFRAKHEEFLEFMGSSAEDAAAAAPTDENEESRSMREALAKNVRAATEAFQSSGIQIERMRLQEQDVETLKVLVELSEFRPPEIQIGRELFQEQDVEVLQQITELDERVATPKEGEETPSQDTGIHTLSLSHESWAPSEGTSQVGYYQTYQTFRFNNTQQFALNSASTYEHEVQVYNTSFANYSGYWSSNLPSAYYDTPFLDSLDNFTVGSAQAASISGGVWYYTYMALSPGGASSATVRIKGQIGHRWPSWCYSTWCIFGDATTASMAILTAPSALVNWQY